MTEQRVRAINAPWPVLALIAVLIGAFAAQSFVGVTCWTGGSKPW